MVHAVTLGTTPPNSHLDPVILVLPCGGLSVPESALPHIL